MDEQELEDGLKAILEDALAVTLGDLDPDEISMPDELSDLIRVATFEEDGVLTKNRGLVLRARDGSEYQITIVRSR